MHSVSFFFLTAIRSPSFSGVTLCAGSSRAYGVYPYSEIEAAFRARRGGREDGTDTFVLQAFHDEFSGFRGHGNCRARPAGDFAIGDFQNGQDVSQPELFIVNPAI